MLPALHAFLKLHYDKYRKWCDEELPKVREQLNDIKKYFQTPLDAELNTVLSAVDQLFHIVGDYLYDIAIAGKPDVQWILADERLIDVLNKPLFGKSIDYWLRTPLLQLAEHIVDQTVFVHGHTKVANNFIHHRIKLVLKSFSSSNSADELVKLLQEADLKTALFPVRQLLTRFTRDLWLERDLYYEAIRSVIVIPHELVLCVHNELHAQRTFDRERRLFHKQEMQRIFGKYRTTSMAGGYDTLSTDATTMATDALPKEDTNVNPIGQTAYEKAKIDLEKAESKTAELVEWYDTSAKLAQHQKHKKHTDYATSFGRGFFKKRKQTTEQIGAHQAETERRAILDNKFHGSSDNRTHPPLTILDFTVLQLGCAVMSPLHIYHNEWSGTERFVALQHHLHMLDVLMPCVHNDNSYCRHLKSIPVFNLTDGQNKCTRRNKGLRERTCRNSYTLNPNILPRNTIIQLYNCDNRDDIKLQSRYTKTIFRSLKKLFGKKTNSHTKKDVKPRNSRKSRRTSQPRYQNSRNYIVDHPPD
jgi:hypothetical protein